MKRNNHLFICSRHCLFVIGMLLLLPLVASAQDVVTLKDGSTITCKVVEVGENLITFQQEGSNESLSLPFSEIDHVKYANGEMETFGGNRPYANPSSQVSETNHHADTSSSPTPQKQTASSDDDDGCDFTGISYLNSFKSGDKGAWGFERHFSNDAKGYGYGLSVMVSTNIFLVKSKLVSTNMSLGPNISVKLTENGQLRFLLPVMLSGLIYNDYSTDKTKFNLGGKAVPSFVIKINNVYLRLGYGVDYINKNWGHHFYCGIGI